ncbi:MAG: group II intron reverse transcriptase/maturase [Holophagales bacterium]|nr:group II intron reverse transcriptase/maturase [Holophagales bacterium]
MNTGALWPSPEGAKARVLGIQTKLHRWALEAPEKRFEDLFNLAYDPAFLTEAWRRVCGNRGSRSAGVDGQTVYDIRQGGGVENFLADLRNQLKGRQFRPFPVRERMIPKPGSTRKRRLGIPTVRDRVVQAALKLVMEPIFEADFRPCSYGFRPNRRAQDALAEIHFFTSRGYEWVLEGDIRACFDEIDHSALLDRVRERIGDRRLLQLVKAFCKSGILTEVGSPSASPSGTPQGGILSPLLANIALSVLDDSYTEDWQSFGATSSARQARRRKGLATYRLVRYADDFVVLVAGRKEDAIALRKKTTTILAPMGLLLSKEKTQITHIDDGFDFLGFRIRRSKKPGTEKRMVYTWPSKSALASIKAKIRSLSRQSRNLSLEILLHRLNPVLRGWTNYFRHGVSKRTFSYLRAFTWRRVICWLRHKHPKTNWMDLRRRYLPGWWPTCEEAKLFNPEAVAVTRYRYRGSRISSPWS